MVWRLFQIAYNRVEATLKGFKEGKPQMDLASILEHIWEPGTVLALLFLSLLTGWVFLKRKGII